MFIWPNGEVTGSVHHATLEAFHAALKDGGPLDAFAENIPPGLSADDYADYPLPDEPAEEPAEEPAAEEEDALPKGNASREEWADYGLSHGLQAEQVDDATRDELRAHFTKEVTTDGD
jgi:hypothetical protein